MKTKTFLLLTCLTLALSPPVCSQNAQRKKVAVVLSGGGAKGMAHIGVLKVIEKAGIPIDMIVGTSMGSIVGGLYSVGYSASTLDTLVRNQDWRFLLSDKPRIEYQSLYDRSKQNTYFITREFSAERINKKLSGGYIEGKNLRALFNNLTYGYRDSMDFNDLPIPFACVATNIMDNTECVCRSGILTEAMRSSMAIPGMFSAVRNKEKLFVDGGMKNNYPADVARDMGADYVIGVSVAAKPHSTDEVIQSGRVITQILDMFTNEKVKENIEKTDIFMQVDVEGYNSLSFNQESISELIKRGERTAQDQWGKLMELKRKLGLPDDYHYKMPSQRHVQSMPGKMKLNRITFLNVTERDEKFIRKKYKLDKIDSVSIHLLDHIIATMRVDLFYSAAYSYFEPQDDGYDITIEADVKKLSQVSLALRYDDDEAVAAQINGEFLMKWRQPIMTNLTLRLGKRIVGRADFDISTFTFGKVMLSCIFNRSELNINDEGKRTSNLTYNQHVVDLVPFYINLKNFNINLGAREEYYKFSSYLTNTAKGALDNMNEIQNTHYYIYHADINYNSEDKWVFPTKGAFFQARYNYVTDNFVSYNHQLGFSCVNALWRYNFPLTSRFSLQPMLYGRLVFGYSDLPYPLLSFVGGIYFNHFVDYQQMPFPGVQSMELVKSKFAAVQLKAQQRIGRANYLQLRTGAFVDADRIDRIFAKGPKIGVLASYFYNSMIGPLGASLGWSSKSKNIFWTVNLGFEF